MPGCSLVGGVPRTVAADDETFGHNGHPPGDKTSMTESSTMPAWCASARRGLATYFPGQESNTPPGLSWPPASRGAGGSSAQPQRDAVPAVIGAPADRYAAPGWPINSRLSCIPMRYQTWGDYPLDRRRCSGV